MTAAQLELARALAGGFAPLGWRLRPTRLRLSAMERGQGTAADLHRLERAEAKRERKRVQRLERTDALR